MLLKDMGKAGLAVMVLGTAACAAEPSDTPTTPTPEPTSSSSPPAPSSTFESGVPTTNPAAAGHVWHRVNLGFVSAYLLYRGGVAALVDTGVAGSEAAIEAALGEIGLAWDAVGHVVVTHKHDDHQGSLEAALTRSGAPWYAGAGDMAAISADTPGMAVGDGDSVFDLQVIETPGHTPGHIAVLDSVAGVLVAGDALTGTGPGVAGPNTGFTEDMNLANASITKLAGFDYEVALFGHGDPIESGASTLVAELAADLG